MKKVFTKFEKGMKLLSKKVVACALLITIFAQMMAITGSALLNEIGLSSGSGSSNGGILNGIGKFESDEVIAELKKSFIGSLNKDLVTKIESYQLKGNTDVIITFSDDSLVAAYNNSSKKNGLTFAEYCDTSAASNMIKSMEKKQASVLSSLEEAGLIDGVKHTYTNIMDAAFVSTTYEQIEAICNFEGVERVVLSDTYLPAATVENPVDVYYTGIFNSGSVEYTGKGTVVAILDTGCDYTHTAFTTHEVVNPHYDRDAIAKILPNLISYSYDNALEAREVYYGNITLGKIAYGYDYADKDPDVMPFGEGHGTHVAGIIGGYDETITGVAIDTQFAIMKVFSDYDAAAKDGDILAALEDAVTLGVDAINMSLGSSCGFSREADNDYKNEVFDRIAETGISLVVAAANDYSSGFGSDEGNTNKTDNPDSATVGAPATYEASFTVASINGTKDKYMYANGNLEVFFKEAYNQNTKEYDFFEMLGITASNPHEVIEYVTIPGYGYSINYSGVDVNGKIALVSRGDITFEEKVQFAYEAGARAIIIYNNVFGDISMTVGNNLKIPVISIGKDEGDAMAALPGGTIEFDYYNVAGPFMSDFSSWGPTPDLHLKPEITAHGGNILSAIPGGEYDELSGTSMAAPNMAGIVVLIRQYVKEKYPQLTAIQVRDLVNQLCMSTATIALDKKGNPYSPRKQGAGIADITKSTTTNAYLTVDGIGKTKLELGDDPTRSGVYTMTINLNNLSDVDEVSYRLGNIVMTESVSTSEPEYVAEMAYLLSNSSEYSVVGGRLEGDVVTVAPGETAKITATITLSAKDKSYLNANFANGMYVEGYLTFDNVDENGVDLNAPFLAFYGDWGEAPIFDLDYYEVETEAHNNAIDDDDKIKADYYATTPMGTYYYDYVIPLGTYVYEIDKSEYNAIPATQEHAAISYYADSISGVYGVFAGLLRGAKELNIQIINTATGEVVWSKTDYNCPKAHYYGGPAPYSASFNLSAANYETGDVIANNNVKLEVVMTAKLDWDGEERNSSDTYSFSFYIDYEAPTVVDAKFRTEYDKSKKQNRYYADVWVYDNHYAMSIRPIIAYEYVDDDGEVKKTYSALIDNPIPIYQEKRGETTKVTLELTDYLDKITGSIAPEGLTLYIDDYAMNAGVSYIPFPEAENGELEFSDEVQNLELDINETLDLSAYLMNKDTATLVEADYLRGLVWSSSDESVVAVNGGRIEARGKGTATISVTGSTWVTKNLFGKEMPLYKSVVIKVTDQISDTSKPQIEALEFVSYETLFAFTNDIDYSKIGITGALNYFGKDNSITFYPSEQVKLNYTLEPWNLADNTDSYELSWVSSNPRVASVDENGVVTAESEGTARISLQISIDGKTSLLAARCTVTVKSEFIVENRTLVAYKGKGGDVVIPDDKGILTIGAFAFSHFKLDNEMSVEKDENGYYDLDLKKTPYGNDTVTSVVIPDGVETISKYAFYNCQVLREVTLPETCTKIEKNAFEKCSLLETVNFENVDIISNYAFYMCESLVNADLSSVYAIGDYAFAGGYEEVSDGNGGTTEGFVPGARFDSIELTNLSRIGVGAFANCTKLENVVLGKKTRISKSMFENTPITEIVIYSDIVSDYAFSGCEELESVTFMNDLTYLGVEAFSGCSSLKDVEFEGVCEQIASFAFFECTSLDVFYLPNCNVSLGDGAFASSAIRKLVFDDETIITAGGIGVFDKVKSLSISLPTTSGYNNYKVVNSVLYTGDGTCLVMLIPGSTASSITIPESVTSIADGAFSTNTSITTVKASNSALKSIGYGAFANCSSLRILELPSNAVTIGDYAFYNTLLLKSLDAKKVTSVGEFAFEGSGITEIDLSSPDVVVGRGAFFGNTSLTKVKLGARAVIGEYAFSTSNVKTVELCGSGVNVANSAFSGCSKLSSIDFSAISGALGDFAFYGCTSIKSVNAPEITSIGMGCFADCYSLQSFSAQKLEVIGDYAFSAYAESSQRGAAITGINAPNLKKVGAGAFYMCVYLESIDLTKVTEIGMTAFAGCSSLKKADLSVELSELADFVFYECYKLSGVNLDNVVRFGKGCLYGVTLPSTLELPNAEYIGAEAFVEAENKNNLVEFIAPKVTYIGEQAFLGCYNLAVVYAPSLKEIGSAAFAYTDITEFEVFESLAVLGSSVFEGCEKFEAFFTTVNGEKVNDAEYDGVMIRDGVLYVVRDNGYELSVYPMAKSGEVFEVAPGTVRIDYCAAIGNENVVKVILPESLRYIGNHAFYKCDNLTTVVFKSYYAPTLEGTLTGNKVDINTETIEDYPGFDKLYKYDYYYRIDGNISAPYYYNTFINTIASKDAEGLTYIIPENNSGYDTKIYKAYFTASTENSGTVMGPYAIAFIDAVNKLPEVCDRFDTALIEAAIVAYNALEGREDAKFVDEALVKRFEVARRQYNISVAERKISQLFDIDNSEYSFNKVKDARATYLALTDEEKAGISNYDVLENKISDLCAAMGLNPDFSKEYKDHFPEEPDAPSEPPADPEPSDKIDGLVIAIIIIASALAVTAAVVVVIIFKKKSSTKLAADDQAEDAHDNSVDSVDNTEEIKSADCDSDETKEVE